MSLLYTFLVILLIATTVSSFPKCPENMEYAVCPLNEATCEVPKPPKKYMCAKLLVCECKKHFYRHKGKCVRADVCAKAVKGFYQKLDAEDLVWG
uniref:TIL domain-containing protein n=1 Tax=Panagrellus redivivus TaxID=6233 RepID=A0A7E4UYY2_PANRE